MGGLGFAFMVVFVNPLSAYLTIGAFAFYVVVYTLILKRTTPLNIVIGGAAGALPPVIGWAAVTGTVGVEAVLMFAIVTLWTPPHFWALSINYASDYERAGVPMLPVVAGADETKRWIFWHTLALVATTIALAFAGDTGLIYFGAAVVLGAGFIWLGGPPLALAIDPRSRWRCSATRSSTWRCFSGRSRWTRWWGSDRVDCYECRI